MIESDGPCNLCEGFYKLVLERHKNMSEDSAYEEALKEFRKIYQTAECIKFYTCMPIIRSSIKNSDRITKSGK